MRMRIAAGLAAVVMAVLAAAAPAVADPEPSPDAIYHTLGVNQLPADYVVLVDVSGSMDAAHLYGPVKQSLRALFASLAPQDEVTLITFAGTTKQVFQGPIGNSPDAPIAHLPARADGGNTDIGRALAASVSVLSRPSALPIASVIMLTDGKHQPASGSPYPLTSGYAWDQLRDAAANLHQESLHAYAIPLAANTGVNLLAKVYGKDASVLSTTSVDRLVTVLGQSKEAVRVAKAHTLLAADLTQGVQVSWQAPATSLGDGASTVPVTLRSPTTHLPLTVTGLRVSACGGVVAGVSPATVALQPGQAVTVQVSLTWQAGPLSWSPVHTTRQTCPLRLDGTVGSPWADFLATDLGTPLTRTAIDSVQPVTFSAARGSLSRWLLVLLLVLLGGAAATALRWRRAHPMLNGVMVGTLPSSGAPVSFPLRGRRTTISAATAGMPGSGVVSGRSGPRVEIAYSRDGSASGRDVRTCGPGETVTVSGVSFEWRPKKGR